MSQVNKTVISGNVRREAFINTVIEIGLTYGPMVSHRDGQFFTFENENEKFQFDLEKKYINVNQFGPVNNAMGMGFRMPVYNTMYDVVRNIVKKLV